MRTGQKHCKLVLLTSSVALMVGVTSLVVYLAWMVTAHGHVTGVDIKSNSRSNDTSNGVIYSDENGTFEDGTLCTLKKKYSVVLKERAEADLNQTRSPSSSPPNSSSLSKHVPILICYQASHIIMAIGKSSKNRSHERKMRSAQIQEINIKDSVNGKHEETTVETLHINKVHISDRRRRKKVRKNPNDILNLRKSWKAKVVLTANKTDEIVQQRKNIAKNAKKRKTFYGFKKKKSKKAFEKVVKLEIMSRDKSDSDTLPGEMAAVGLGLSTDGSRVGPISDNHRNKARSPWGDWTPCSVECGLGQQERVRSCGDNCQEIESKPCLTRPCEGAKMTDKWAYFEMFDLTEREVTSESGDACEMWMKCSNKSIHHYLSNIAKLPSCPCFYPISLAVDDKVYDRDREQHFSWEDASGPREKNHVYRPGAKFCIRSRLPEQSVTLAAQHCCYDGQLRLITRGRDAGTPNLVSPQLSRELHKKVDILPWIICKGDWTRYNMVIQPNNYRQCSDNPCLGELQHQLKLAKSY